MSTTVARQCTLCEAQCGILVTVDGDQVTRIQGNPEDVMSHGYICPKATAMGGLHHDPDRLRTPVRRIGDQFEPIGWDEAFDEIGRRLRKVRHEHGPHAIAMYMGNPAAHTSAVIHGGLLRGVGDAQLLLGVLDRPAAAGVRRVADVGVECADAGRRHRSD
jgi:anaerobic selenocysteine-containing dehydrogenase